MNDEQAIANTVYSYSDYLDTGDFEALGLLFENAVIRTAGVDGVRRGAAAARELMEQSVMLYDGIPNTKHVTTNLMIEVDDDGQHASAKSYFTALQAVPGLPLQPILAGRWHDQLRRIDGRWRFVDRTIHLDLMGDARNHVGEHGVR